jgi:hypothetical protein
MSYMLWTEAVVRALPVTVPIATAAAVLGVGSGSGSGSGYKLARSGQLPTLQLGRRKLVRRADLLARARG